MNWKIASLSILLITLVSAVNRDNFKSCEQSSFCHRQRSISPDTLEYKVIRESISIDKFGVKANLSRVDSAQILTLDLLHLAHSTFRVTVDEPEATPTRYRLGAKMSLKQSPTLKPVKITKSADSLTLVGDDGAEAVLFFHPFHINFLMDGVVVSQFNRRKLFNFEVPVYPPDPPTTEAPTVTPAPETPETTEVHIDTDNSDPSASSEMEEQVPTPTDSPDEAIPESTEDHHDEGTDETPTPSSTPNLFPWSENFKEHRDTRPYGPRSLSADIDFPGFSFMYGIPEHADSFTLRSTSGTDPYRLYNLDVFEYELNNPMALYGAVPFLWALNSNHTVGVFWHNPSETWIDVDYTDRPTDGLLSKIRFFSRSSERYSTSRWMSESGVLDVFIMLGREPKSISEAYAYLTGSTPLPPLFALAYHQCRWNYKDQQDVYTVDENFDTHVIPVDVIWLDIEHTDGKRYFTWDSVKFPSPGEMVDKLLSKGRKLVTVVDPHIKQDTSWEIFKQGVDNNYYIKTRDGADFIGWCWPGSSAWPDFTNEQVRRWWAEKFLTYDPVRIDTMYSWNDMGEPSVFSGPEITIHKDTVHHGGVEHRDIHNIYGMLVHQATWEGQLLRSNGRERPFVLTRAFFAGSQRTAAVWTGDNTASWEHLQISIPMTLSLSLTGITFCGADVGGFFGNTEPELLARWYQAGAYQPFFRAHKHMDTKRHEPWTLPEEYMSVAREAIIERYQLLPYWYTQFARSEVDGQPVMVPIWYHFRHLESTYNLEHEYMIGEAILVCPVTKAGAKSVDLYLPPGVWYHQTTLETHPGNRRTQHPVTLKTTPVFYRGGFIIPRRDRIRRSSWLMRNDPFTLFVLLDPAKDSAHGYLYDDDYHSTSRETARFYRFEYEADRDPTTRLLAGGTLHVKQLPLPGSQTYHNPGGRELHLERIVFIGLQHPLTRISLIHKSGEKSNLDFIQERTPHADARYHGDRKNGFAIVRCPGLSISPDWRLHLVTGNELKSEL